MSNGRQGMIKKNQRYGVNLAILMKNLFIFTYLYMKLWAFLFYKWLRTKQTQWNYNYM